MAGLLNEGSTVTINKKEDNPMEHIFGEYRISNDKALLSIQRIKELLAQSYWAKERPIEAIEMSVRNSDCYGVYLKGEQIGVARVVSDNATVFWLCDVIIDEKHRGKGFGSQLITEVIEDSKRKGMKRVELDSAFHREKAHLFYAKLGFEKRAFLFSYTL